AHAETRELGAHVHGQSEMSVAIEETAVEILFKAPAADIFGFETEAETEEQKAVVEEALEKLGDPIALLGLPEAASCTVEEVDITHAAGDHEGHDHDHDHDAHGDDDHNHDDHAEDDHADHDHAEEEHAHDDHAHDDHAHEDHAHEDGHSDVEARYRLSCEDTGVIDRIALDLFTRFPNAEAVEVAVVGTDVQTGGTLTPSSSELRFR
ncbi:MAG: DUF2796 domain-containing protein, partial [Pseudomonadota bacterium]